VRSTLRGERAVALIIHDFMAALLRDGFILFCTATLALYASLCIGCHFSYDERRLIDGADYKALTHDEGGLKRLGPSA